MYRIDASGSVEEVFERILEKVMSEWRNNFDFSASNIGLRATKLSTEQHHNI